MTLPVSVGLRSKPRKMGDAVLGSWTRTAAVAAVVLIAFLVVAVLAITGRLADLRYTNIPLVHPYPPAGYYPNPFNPGERGDLVNAAEAGRVKADLLHDGDVQLAAFAAGDPAGLSQVETSNALKAAQQLMAANNSKGVFERAQNHLDSIVVGRLADPNDASVTWCVQEKGASTITLVDKSTGKAVQTQSIRFDAKYWLVQTGGRYLIADVAISTSAGSSG
jgi:hypothetical protein